MIGACIFPSEDNGSTLSHILDAKKQRPGLRTIVLGNFNIDMMELALTDHDINIMAAFASIGLDNMIENFCLNHHHHNGFTWKQ